MIAHSLDEHARSLADYLPSGRLFEAKNINDSNFRELLLGLSGELFTSEGYLITLEKEYIPDQTTLFLSEWEQALQIPDDCFRGTGTIIERRRDILTKLAAMAVQTDDDFIALGDLYGVPVAITSGIDEITFPLTFPITMFSTLSDARYTIVVKFTVTAANRFPLTFPIVFGTPELAILECIFERVKPSNCNVLFQQV